MIHADTKVTDVIDNPLFAGYGRLIFPTAFGRPSASMTLDEVGSLLIYHNYVNTDTTIDVIREMEERRKQGEKIFYDIYRAGETPGSGKAGHRSFLLQGRRQCSLRRDLRRRRVLLCGLNT